MDTVKVFHKTNCATQPARRRVGSWLLELIPRVIQSSQRIWDIYVGFEVSRRSFFRRSVLFETQEILNTLVPMEVWRFSVQLVTRQEKLENKLEQIYHVPATVIPGSYDFQEGSNTSPTADGFCWQRWLIMEKHWQKDVKSEVFQQKDSGISESG